MFKVKRLEPLVHKKLRNLQFKKEQQLNMIQRHNHHFPLCVDEQGQGHEVWFEDARSAQAKFNMIKEYNLRGVSYWALGNPFRQNWELLDDNFNINTGV